LTTHAAKFLMGAFLLSKLISTVKTCKQVGKTLRTYYNILKHEVTFPKIHISVIIIAKTKSFLRIINMCIKYIMEKVYVDA